MTTTPNADQPRETPVKDPLLAYVKPHPVVCCRFCGEDVPRYSVHDCRVARKFTSTDWGLIGD